MLCAKLPWRITFGVKPWRLHVEGIPCSDSSRSDTTPTSQVFLILSDTKYLPPAKRDTL